MCEARFFSFSPQMAASNIAQHQTLVVYKCSSSCSPCAAIDPSENNLKNDLSDHRDYLNNTSVLATNIHV